MSVVTVQAFREWLMRFGYISKAEFDQKISIVKAQKPITKDSKFVVDETLKHGLSLAELQLIFGD